MSKKIIAVITAIIMIIQFGAVFADGTERDAAEKVLSIVKERIGSTDEYDKFESNVFEYDGEKRYEFHWTNEDYSKSMAVNCGENGIIYSYNKFSADESYGGEPWLNELPKEEAQEKAYALLQALNPLIGDKLILEGDTNSSLYSSGFSFNVIHIENGYRVADDNGYISVDKNAEKIISFYINYTAGNLFEKSEVVPKDKAFEAYRNNLGIELKYLDEYKEREKIIFPAYVEKDNYGKYINAQTGEVYERSAERYYPASGAVKTEAMAEDNEGFVPTPAEKEELDTVEGLLSKQEIISKIKKNTVLEFPKGYENERFGYVKEFDGRRIAVLNLEKINADGFYSSVHFRIDAETGEILGYTNYSEVKNNSKATIKSSEIKNNLKKSAEHLCGEEFSEYKESAFNYPENKDDYYAYINYTRYVNGIPYEDDRLSITADIRNGKITDYAKTYTKKEFPSLENVVGEDAAYNEIYSKLSYEPVYILENKEGKKTAALVYEFVKKPYIEIDAYTGKFRNDFDKKEYKFEYSDIENHYCENAVKRLSEYGIGFYTDKFLPDEDIRQKDLMLLLSNAVSGGRLYNANDKELEEAYKNAYNTAKAAGIISENEIAPEEYVTRLDSAVYIIRMMHLEKAAKIDGIYLKIFPDVEERKGYVNILKGLSVINGDENGNFNPYENTKRGDFAIILFNSLSI